MLTIFLRKACVIAILSAVLVSVSSCGGSGSGTVVVVPSTGDILIENDPFSSFSIDFIEIDGPEFIQFFPFISPGDAVLFASILTGNYTVTIGWTDLSTNTFFNVPVLSNSETIVTGFN